MAAPQFHLSIAVSDLDRASDFYAGLLGCAAGRGTPQRTDFNFFGHNLVAHLQPQDAVQPVSSVLSEGVSTPCRHFGVNLPVDEWTPLSERLIAKGAHFHTPPQIVHRGTPRACWTMMLHDGCGNVIEFKANERPPG